MSSKFNSEMIRHIDTELPVSSVLKQATTFLEQCGWALEIEDETINIPRDAELLVRSRALIEADLHDEVISKLRKHESFAAIQRICIC